MLEWYRNKKVGIYFDKIPNIGIRYFVRNPELSLEENEKIRKHIEKYPFVCKEDLYVEIEDIKNNFSYTFEISNPYYFDGASIPKFFHRVIGANTDNKFLIPALVHDVLCENHNYINYNRKLSSEVFNALLEANKVNPFKRFLMKHSVNSFQMFCGWGH